MMTKIKIGIIFQPKLVHWSNLKAATKAPTNIRKIVPGPITVPIIRIIYKKYGIIKMIITVHFGNDNLA